MRKKVAMAAVFKLGGATRCNKDRLDFARPHLNDQMPHLMGFQPPGPELSKSKQIKSTGSLRQLESLPLASIQRPHAA